MPGPGFSGMSQERRREIASAGGRAAQESGNGRRWTTEQASAAGRLGGTKVAADREHMARIGRLGAAGKKAAAAQTAKPDGEQAGHRTLRVGALEVTVPASVQRIARGKAGAAKPPARGSELRIPVAGAALQDEARSPGFSPPQPQPAAWPLLAPKPSDPPSGTAAERIQAAAQARAAQRQALIGRGDAWHVRAAMHVSQMQPNSKENP